MIGGEAFAVAGLGCRPTGSVWDLRPGQVAKLDCDFRVATLLPDRRAVPLEADTRVVELPADTRLVILHPAWRP